MNTQWYKSMHKKLDLINDDLRLIRLKHSESNIDVIVSILEEKVTDCNWEIKNNVTYTLNYKGYLFILGKKDNTNNIYFQIINNNLSELYSNFKCPDETCYYLFKKVGEKIELQLEKSLDKFMLIMNKL